MSRWGGGLRSVPRLLGCASHARCGDSRSPSPRRNREQRLAPYPHPLWFRARTGNRSRARYPSRGRDRDTPLAAAGRALRTCAGHCRGGGSRDRLKSRVHLGRASVGQAGHAAGRGRARAGPLAAHDSARRGHPDQESEGFEGRPQRRVLVRGRMAAARAALAPARDRAPGRGPSARAGKRRSDLQQDQQRAVPRGLSCRTASPDTRCCPA